MRKLINVFIILISFTGCNEVDKLLTFNIKNETEITIPAAANINTPLNIPTPDIKTNSEDQFKNNNTKKDLVKDVKLTSMSLLITEPEGKTFSFLKSIIIYISADGVTEKKIAYKENIHSNIGNTLELTSTNEKLDEYIKKEFFNIRTVVTTDEAMISEVRINAKMNFRVTADML